MDVQFIRLFIRQHLIAGLVLLCTASAYGETLEKIRQQFEIYQRLSGEIEILSSNNIQEIDNVLKRTAEKCQTVRRELEKARMEDRPKKSLPSPLFMEDYTAPFLHYVTVERTVARRALEQGKPDEMLQSIRSVYFLADELVDSESLELRAAAARIRLQMLEAVQSLLLHPMCRREHQEQLHKIFEYIINHRTTDEAIWVSYRKEGLRFFEETKQGGLEKTVSPKLLKMLLERQALDVYRSETLVRFARDQLVFSQVMGAMIKSCSVPYFKRQSELLLLDTKLLEQRGQAEEPVFAVMLLQDVTALMRLFAQEKSGMEMAYLALSAGVDQRIRHQTLNFLTGSEYKIILVPDGLMCTYEGNVKPFYVYFR